MEFGTLINFAWVAFLLALMPGPDVIFVLAQSLSKGARAGLSISAGLVSGIVVHTLLCATGVSIILLHSPAAFLAVKIFCAGYLLYLAFQALREKPEAMDAKKDAAHNGANKTFFKYYARGFVMNVSNPKVLLFFIAFLPTFISDKASFPPAVQIMIFGLAFMAAAYVAFALVSFVCGFFARLLASRNFWIFMKYARAAIFIYLAVLIFMTTAGAGA